MGVALHEAHVVAQLRERGQDDVGAFEVAVQQVLEQLVGCCGRAAVQEGDELAVHQVAVAAEGFEAVFDEGEGAGVVAGALAVVDPLVPRVDVGGFEFQGPDVVRLGEGVEAEFLLGVSEQDVAFREVGVEGDGALVEGN